MKDTETPQLPPVSLVRTWLWMMLEANDEQLKAESQERLLSVFGNLKAVVEYVEANNIQSSY